MTRTYRLGLIALCLIPGLCRTGLAQSTDPGEKKSVPQEHLVEVLLTARKQAEEYNTLFRDLAAKETRTSILFNKNGQIDRKRMVVCEFVVYQSRFDPKLAFEYRNAISVDGKPLAGQDKRMMKLFEEISAAKMPIEERELINRDSFKNDLTRLAFYGTVIYQWRELMEFARDSVQITFVGTAQVEGQETMALQFDQITANASLEWELPQAFSQYEQRVRCKLWLDTRTAQIRRAERVLTLIVPGAPAPVPVWQQTFTYNQSEFGILTPKRFVYDYSLDLRQGPDGQIESFPTGRLISEFGTFQRFTVSSKEEDKKTIIKDQPQSDSEPTKPRN